MEVPITPEVASWRDLILDSPSWLMLSQNMLTISPFIITPTNPHYHSPSVSIPWLGCTLDTLHCCNVSSYSESMGSACIIALHRSDHGCLWCAYTVASLMHSRWWRSNVLLMLVTWVCCRYGEFAAISAWSWGFMRQGGTLIVCGFDQNEHTCSFHLNVSNIMGPSCK